jgi:PAS domain S-box-containing protein/diguanylate cyclase (GGDEF)-like protein
MAPVDRAELARRWTSALNQVSYVARSRTDIERELVEFIDRLVQLVSAADFTCDSADEVGARLVELGFTKPACLQRTMDILGTALGELPQLRNVAGATGKVASVLGALAGGFATGMRSRLFADQEDVKRALAHAKENVERDLEASEALFREIFTSSTVGMALSDLDGTLVRTNRALANILEYRPNELAGKRLDDLFHPDEAEYLWLRYRALLNEHPSPFRDRSRFQRKDGDEALVYLSGSVLRHPDGTPRHYVTTVEDVSDRHLLEGQLRHQATHDALTGLANRQRFIGRIEEVLRGKHAVDDLTLFHIDLDGFSAVNNGPGREVGDTLLQTVAIRLLDMVSGESAMVARLDADQFGIIIENTPDTPNPASIAQRINDELGEPVYVGDDGVAATACIAVLHRPEATAEPADLLQATDTTLRRLKAAGRRQWGLVEMARHKEDRERFNLAASIPGAWESGEIELEYQPVVDVEDGRVVAVQPMLCWNHAELGKLEHERCVAVLAETGLSQPIGRWMLGLAGEQIMSWRDRVKGDLPQLCVELTRQQAADPDLVSAVRAALTGTGLPVDRLRLGMPADALCMLDGAAEENLDILVDVGVTIALCEFGTTRGDLACLEDLPPLQAVKFAPRVTRRVARGVDEGTLFVRAVRDLVPLVRGEGTSVIVSGIESEKQLEWWREVGAQYAQGPLFGAAGPPEDIEELFVC